MIIEFLRFPEKVTLNELGVSRPDFIAKMGGKEERNFLVFRELLLRELNKFLSDLTNLLVEGISVEFQMDGDWLQYKKIGGTVWINVLNLREFIENVIQESKLPFGSKYSALDPGVVGEVTIDDDFMYVCVESGSAGNARWKRTPLKLI